MSSSCSRAAATGCGAAQGPGARRLDQSGLRNIRERAGVLFSRDDTPVAGHNRAEQLQAAVARRVQHLHAARRCGRQPGDDRGVHQGTARAQGGFGPLHRECRRRAIPVAEPVSRDGEAGAQYSGRHAQGARFLFKSGVFLKESSAQLEIRKSGFEQSIFRVAHNYSFLYGVFAISLAMLTGWLGRLVFRRD
jgi:hypothetical protein